MQPLAYHPPYGIESEADIDVRAGRLPSRIARAPISCGQPAKSGHSVIRSCADKRSIESATAPRLTSPSQCAPARSAARSRSSESHFPIQVVVRPAGFGLHRAVDEFGTGFVVAYLGPFCQDDSHGHRWNMPVPVFALTTNAGSRSAGNVYPRAR